MRQFLAESSNSISSYWDHLRNEPDYITIGYARKSFTKETDESRTRLLQLMVDKLYFRMKCEEAYISPRCFAHDPILERDSPPLDHFTSAIKGCNGSITDLTKRLHYTQRPIRLAIIDYAGLSTSPNDIRLFLNTYPDIKEIAIDHSKSIEILTRHQLLEKSDAEKFNCRIRPVQRSKYVSLVSLFLVPVLKKWEWCPIGLGDMVQVWWPGTTDPVVPPTSFETMGTLVSFEKLRDRFRINHSYIQTFHLFFPHILHLIFSPSSIIPVRLEDLKQ